MRPFQLSFIACAFSKVKFLLAFPIICHGFAVMKEQGRRRYLFQSNVNGQPIFSSSSSLSSSLNDGSQDDKRVWYQRGDGMWRPRVDIHDLRVGQRMFCTKLEDGIDLLDGKTGAKLFYDCGVGRFVKGRNGETRMKAVNGMLRIGGPRMKASVVRKKKQKLVKQERELNMIPMFVSRIRPEEGRFEVTANIEDTLEEKSDRKTSASSLKVGEELIGRIYKLTPYGAFIDVGASRNGLLHIQTVADFFGTYIDKQKGLTKNGLEVGARVKVVVQSNEKKRLSFDFTDTAKKEQKSLLEKERIKEEASKQENEKVDMEFSSADLESDEAAMWAQFAAAPSLEENDEDEDDDSYYSDYDEDRDIESSLGLDYY